MNPFVLKIRGGSDTYVKPDGKKGTAGKGPLLSEDVAFTIAVTQDQTLFVPMERNQVLGDTSYVVRRLMPIETERLQGFWDNHTDLTGCDPDAILERMPQYRDADEKGKRAIERKVRRWCEGSPDGARYKCAGNSMAVPVMRFLAERIQMVDEMASGGAPLS